MPSQIDSVWRATRRSADMDAETRVGLERTMGRLLICFGGFRMGNFGTAIHMRQL